MTTPVTAQQAQDITNSANVFEEGVNMMNQIYNNVFAAQDQLKGQSMITTAGSAFAAAVIRWTDDFNVIKQTLQQMHDQLLTTTQQTAATDIHNQDTAAGLPS